jgi:hypothetical protein
MAKTYTKKTSGTTEDVEVSVTESQTVIQWEDSPARIKNRILHLQGEITSLNSQRDAFIGQLQK